MEKECFGVCFEIIKCLLFFGGNWSSYIEGFGLLRRWFGLVVVLIIRVMYDVVYIRYYDDFIVMLRELVVFLMLRRIFSNGGYYSGGSSMVISDEYEDGDYYIYLIY